MPRRRSKTSLGDVVSCFSREHDLLDLVEAVVEAVGDVEIAVDDHVEECPDQETLIVGGLVGALHLEAANHGIELEGLRVVLIVAGLSDRQHPSVGEHDVDLPRDQLVVDEVAVVHRDVEVLAVVLELGALAALVQVFGGDVADLQLGRERIQLGVGGVHAVDPQQRLLRVDGLGEAVRRCVLVPRDPVAVQPCPDHSGQRRGRSVARPGT